MWYLSRSVQNLVNISTLVNKFVKPSKIDNINCFVILKPEKFKTCKWIHDYNKKQITQVDEIIKYWENQFQRERVKEPRESIEYIIAHVLGITKIENVVKISKKKLNDEELQKLDQLCECRLARMPVQYIIGEWDFRYIKLKLEPPIFIPRVETELLVEIVLKKINSLINSKCNILEIGCGSGPISLSLLYENKDVNVFAIDINSHACELTLTNARNIEVQTNKKIENRLFVLNALIKENGTIEEKEKYFSNKSIDFSENKFELIVSNPPYINTKALFKLEPEVKFYEDVVALHGGDDGLELIAPILKYASEALNLNGYLILEVDEKHPNEIESLIKNSYLNKLKLNQVHKDFTDRNRIVEILKIG